MSHWFVYLFTRLDFLNYFLATALDISIACVIISGAAFFVTRGFGTIGEEEDALRISKILYKPFKYLIIFMLLFLILLGFIPSTKEAAVIYLLPKIVNNENVQEIPNNLTKVLNLKMEEWISDLSKIDKGE